MNEPWLEWQKSEDKRGQIKSRKARIMVMRMAKSHVFALSSRQYRPSSVSSANSRISCRKMFGILRLYPDRENGGFSEVKKSINWK
jgi:hypothetical protein